MDTSGEFNIVKAKQANGTPVTPRDVAVAIQNHDETLLDFMVQNDLPQVNTLLHESDSPMVVGKNTTFIPDAKRVEGELHLLFVKKDWNTLNQIVSQFVINPNARNITGNVHVLSSLRDIGATKMGPNGRYRFLIRFN